jgi:hypothetical protein
VGGLVVVAGPWSLAFGALDNIADTSARDTETPSEQTANAADELTKAGLTDAGSIGTADGDLDRVTGPAVGAGRAVPEAGTVAAIAATTSIGGSEESSLVATVGGSVSNDGAEIPSSAGVHADLYCDHGEVRRAVCGAAAEVLGAPES